MSSSLAWLAPEPLSISRAVDVALERNIDVVNAAFEADAAQSSRSSALVGVGPRVRFEGCGQRRNKPTDVSLCLRRSQRWCRR